MSGPTRWTAMPVFALRQSGFPVDLLESLADVDTGAETTLLLHAERAAHAAAAALKKVLRETGADLTRVAPLLGMLAPLSAAVPYAEEYHSTVSALSEAWRRFEASHTTGLEQARRSVVAGFQRDPALREVLLLSNDAHYPRFEKWLADFAGDVSERSARRMVDLLTMYLQRVTTKNETTAHFGPISCGRFTAEPPGVDWSEASGLERVVFFAHWAAEALAQTFARQPALREYTRPRRRPLALLEGNRLIVCAPTTKTGFVSDWRLEQTDEAIVSPEQAWLLEHCDGGRTLAQLRRIWTGGDLDSALAELVDRDWVILGFEIPVGEPYPLRALYEALPQLGLLPEADQAHDLLTDWEDRLNAFVRAGHDRRPALLEQLKHEFTKATRQPANRRSGRHYADRSILFEECHGRPTDLTLGPDLAELLAQELAPVYDLVLAGPRLRVCRESDILARWLTKTFGPETPVPLARFYRAYFADRKALDAECRAVDDELERLDQQLTDLLLGAADPAAREVLVDRARVEEWLVHNSGGPPALCNPDVMLVAPDTRAIARGDYTVVVGDCHAVREVLSHTSFTPLLTDRAPELADHAFEGYRSLLADGELLCEPVRSHPNKTGSQIAFPCPDVEITGRSAQSRSEVIQPSNMYLEVCGGKAELRAEGFAERLRLTTPPAGGPSIRQDPLSPFAFPRHFGGIALRARHRTHLPRIRCGRVVLCRETWRVPAAEVRGQAPGGLTGGSDAAGFYAVQALRRRLGMPRHVFAKLTTEPKPVFVDLEAPLLVRQLCRLAKKAETIEFTEMLPDMDSLWLRIDGRRYTSELRFCVFSEPRLSAAVKTFDDRQETE